MNLGEKIKAARKKTGLTQKQLADNTGISLMSIRRYEANERQPNIGTLEKIAIALGVSISYLVESSEQIDWHYPADIQDNMAFIKNNADPETFKLITEKLKKTQDEVKISLQSLLNEKQALEKQKQELKLLERIADVTKKINPLGVRTVIEHLEELEEPLPADSREAALERMTDELMNYDPTDIAEVYGTSHPFDHLFTQERLTRQEAKTIADELGVTFDYLVGYTDDPIDELPPAIKILSLLSGLNIQGQQKVLDRIDELLEVPKYQKDYKPNPQEPSAEPEEE